jgi:hypothetical protein
MSNLLQLRNQFDSRIAQNATSGQSDFTTDEKNSLANEAIRFISTRAEYPRDIVYITIEAGKPVYTLPTDTLNIILAYLANSSNQDQKVLRVYTEKELVEKRPNWMDESNTGEPDILMLLNRTQVFLSPTPDNATNGKKLLLSYTYYPATLVSDTETPDLPLGFHDLIPIYMAHSAYSGKLLNPAQANNLYTEFETKFKILNTPVTREKDQNSFFWKSRELLNDSDDNYGVTFR